MSLSLLALRLASLLHPNINEKTETCLSVPKENRVYPHPGKGINYLLRRSVQEQSPLLIEAW